VPFVTRARRRGERRQGREHDEQRDERDEQREPGEVAADRGSNGREGHARGLRRALALGQQCHEGARARAVADVPAAARSVAAGRR
jgi:hypothetical protein